ncbi:hypothetical protein PITCH_A460002 [uncultured Desulfobacterium sp.]|uniref:Uncharacterized protein n=1 Tax=uncultured Desulfobacterium sp. TaxID=201089 RepID=A0A445N087_9BACT|nr:hypothetical protein PITCH_A460002 [uncultured Desulfobacterium sp.]
MEKKYVCRQCGFAVREIEIADYSKHDFVNRDKIPPDEIPEYDISNDCEGYDEIEEER